MTKLILVRPGYTDWSKAGRIQGQLDIPLNIEGKRQIRSIVACLANLRGIKEISAIYTSKLSRSFETAAEVGRIFKLKPNKLSELNELNQGLWQGLLEKEIEKRYKKLYNIWKSNPVSTAPPKGESLKDAYDRVVSASQKIADRHRGRAVCIIAHEIVLTLIKCHYKNLDIAKMWEHVPKNATLEVLDVKK